MDKREIRRENNRQMLQNTLAIFNQGYFEKNGRTVPLKLTRSQMEEARVFLPADVQALLKTMTDSHDQHTSPCLYGCENRDSFSQARVLMDKRKSGEDTMPVLVLNLANAVHPGGGVRNGATAQEEDLCRKSSLLVSLEGPQAAPYYAYNRQLHTYMGSDAVMIHPQVEIVKDEKGELLDDTVIVAVLTCAAPNLRFGMEGLTKDQYEAMVYGRIKGMLAVAFHEGYRDLVLGAFGCGAFANDARVVSDLFYKALKKFSEETGGFRRVVFAVLDRTEEQRNYREFSRNFDHFYREEDEKVPEASEKPEAVFFWHENELNGEFSNWYRRKFVIDDFEYLYVEQYMMAQKAKLFHDHTRYTAILRATDPWECKDLGRQVTPFDAKVWNAVRFDIVKAGNRAKFAQNPDLKERLLSTGEAILAEASPKDRIWGIGLDAKTASGMEPYAWPGMNLLGKALMELREEFAKETC